MKPLTSRELECLHWVSMGKTSWEVGMILGVAERTVNFHIQNACEKLGAKGRLAAISLAYRAGLLPAQPANGPLRPNPETPGRHRWDSHRPCP